VSRNGFLVVAGFAVAAILIAVLSLNGPGEKVKTVSGRIRSIDTAARTASLEIVHPKTGEKLLLEGRVPLDCDIRIDDRPATLADLRPGERIEVEGIIHRDRSLSANRVRASRVEATVSSQPASSQPAPGQAAPKP
jgi:hypothetical protein